MYLFDKLLDQWVLLAMAGGVLLVLGLVLGYLAMWRPREESNRGIGAFLRTTPGILLLVYVGIAAYCVGYVIVKSAHPPNW